VRAVLVAITLLAVSPASAQTRSEKNLNTLADDFFWEQQDRQLRPKLSAAGNKAWLAKLRTFESRLGRIKSSALSSEGRVTREMLRQGITHESRFIREGWIQQNLNGHDSLLLTTYEAIQAVERKTVADWRWVIKALASSDRLVTDYITLLEAGMRSGRMQSVDVVDSAIDQSKMFASKSARTNPFVALESELAKTMRGHPRRAELAAELKKALATSQPAYARLTRFLQRRYRPKAPKRPRSKKAYAFNVEKHLGPGYEPNKLAALGRREVARLYRELDKTARQINPKMKSLSSFMNGLSRRKSESFKNGAELLKATQHEVARARHFSKNSIRQVPGERIDVRPMHKADEATEDAQYISTGEKSGTFYINTTQRLNAVQRHELAAVVTHETYGGHHVQGVNAQRTKALPDFRKMASITAYDEGWAMYADHLRVRAGDYTPLEKVGHLKFALWAAAQLVVDVEVNTGKMSRAQANRYMAKYLFTNAEAASGEVDRMMSVPGHALSYYVGRVEMLKLRRLAEKTLGKNFNDKAFHDKLLKSGALPLPLLRHSVTSWLKRSSAQRRRAGSNRTKARRTRKTTSRTARPKTRATRRAVRSGRAR